MTQKDLRTVRTSHIQIQNLNERIARLRSALESCTAKPLSREPKGGQAQKDKLGDDVARLIELEDQCTRKIIDLEVRMQGVEAWLDTLSPQQARVMRLRYMDGLSWRQVARRCGYGYDSVRKMHYRLLKGLDQ